MANKPEDGQPAGAQSEASPFNAPVDEVAATMLAPAPVINRMYVSNTPVGMRMTFAEQTEPGAPIHVRSAVFMSYADALSFRDLLNRQFAIAGVDDSGKTA